MVASKKTRVVLSIEEDVWREFQENLKKHGYPRGTASWIVQQRLESINLEFEALGDSKELEVWFPKK